MLRDRRSENFVRIIHQWPFHHIREVATINIETTYNTERSYV